MEFENKVPSLGPDFNFIRKLPEFSGLPEGIISQIVFCLEREVFEKGKFIFRQGDKVKRLYILEHGKVEIFKKDKRGKKLTLWHIESGGVFCLASLFSKLAFTNALALKDSLVLCISKKELMSILSKQPYLVNRFMGCLSKRIFTYSTIVQDITFRSVPERLASFLLRCIHLNCNNDMLCTVSQTEIASLLGTRREVISRTLKRMCENGIITLIPAGKSRYIKVLDREKLIALSKGI